MGRIAVDGLADASFLIDVSRHDPGAELWLRGRPGFRLALCEFVYAELRAGVDSASELNELLGRLPLAVADRQVSELWGAARRLLKSRGLQIGQNDLWIACTALRHGLPVVTRNAREFSRVPGLTVLAY